MSVETGIMKHKILISILVTTACLTTESVNADTMKIYLPREVNISGDSVVLGDVAIVRGNPEDVAKASAIALGKFSVPGQKIIINRITILSRLASNKISSRNVKLTGAKEIKVGRKELTVSANDISGKASEFLKENKTDASVASYELVRNCTKVVLESQKGRISLVPRLGKSNSVSQVVVDVDIMLDGKKMGTNQVVYRPMYNRHLIVAKKDIPAGTILGADNFEVKKIVSKYPEPEDWNIPVGLVAKRQIKSGQQIRDSLLTRPQPKTVIKRNSLVVIKIETAGLSIVADGKALGEGAFGEIIKVRNTDSDRIITCKINYDGTVSPAK